MAQFPYDKIIVDNLTTKSNISVVRSDTRSKQFLVRQTVGQRYEFDLECRVIPSSFRAANAYLTSLRGGAAVTELTIPFYGQTGLANKGVSASIAIGVRAVTVASATGVEPGMYFKFSSHSKLYCVTSVVGTTINFEPNLVRAVVSGAQMIFDNPVVSCRLASDMPSISSIGNRMPVSFSLKFFEVIS